MLTPKFEQAFAYARQKLSQEILPEMRYHSIEHLRLAVMECERLAQLEGVQEDLFPLLLTAAHFHDLGMTCIQSTDPEVFKAIRPIHEEKSVEIACSVLPGMGFDKYELSLISRIILATKFGHSPQDLLEKIMIDADMSQLGQETGYYLRTTEDLHQEIASFGNSYQDLPWLEYQVYLLSSFNFHTASAHRLYDDNMKRNIAAVQARIQEIKRA